MKELLENSIKPYQKKLKNYINLHPIIFAIILCLLAITFLTITLVYYSDNFNSIGGALWWLIISVITSEPGYADMYPNTLLGQVVQILVVILGIGLFGALIARLSDLFIKYSKRRELGLVEANYKDHFLICGWSNKAKEIINQILTEEINNKQIVLIADIESDPYPKNKLVHFIRGQIDDEATLKKANIDDARSAIVLNEDEEDSTTVLSTLTIKNLNPDLHTVSEISEEQNVVHFKNAGVNEVVVNSTINSQLLFRSAVYGGVSKIIGELLSNKVGNEIYMTSIGTEDVGDKYLDVYYKYKKEKELNLVGIKRDAEIITNPANDLLIKKEDQLFYIGSKDNKY